MPTALAKEELDRIRSDLRARLDDEKLTPMMRQYLSVKHDYPHALVLFRMGDFFEVFFEDAEECARLLDLTLTARSKEKDIPMAGVPHHAIEGYLARLVDLGRTVVLVDQIEDPRQAKGLVRRAVTRILSPGTFLDPSASARTPNYLGAVAFGVPNKKRKKAAATWGLAALELSTGTLVATHGKDADGLVDEVGRLGLKELLVLESARGDPRVTRMIEEVGRLTLTYLNDAEQDLASVQGTLTRIVGEDEVRGAATALSEDALYAAGLALRYAEESQIRPEAPDLKGTASLGHVRGIQPYLPGEALILDAQAREHLELFSSAGRERRGSLLDALDEARTVMGARLLAHWLAYPLRKVAPIKERHDAVEAFQFSQTALDGVRDALGHVSDLERLVGRLAMGRANPKDLVALKDTLQSAPAVLAAARSGAHGLHHDPDGEMPGSPLGLPPKSALLVRLSDHDPCQDVAERLQAALRDDPPADLAKGDVFRPGFDPELDRLSDITTHGKDHIEALEAKEKAETGIGTLKVRFNKVFGYYLEVTKANLHLVPDRYVRKQTTVNSERYFTPELKALEDEVLHAEDKRLARTTLLFSALIDEVGASVGRLSALARALAEIDVLASFAHLAERRGWVRPVVDEGPTIDIGDGRHPVIERLSEGLGERFVPNDIEISDDKRMLIITGPNMAGKSTIMRQTALLVILAQMGCFVPASRARVGLVDRVFTRVGASDDLSRGRSTFMVEMNETARILRSATQRSLILLDEIGRGTSTFDGLSIAWAVAEHLHDVVGARTLFATHYHELTEICRDKPKAANRHVAVKEWNDTIVFLRKLTPGATNRSYGVQVGRLAGLPESVVKRAREVLDGLEAQALSAGNTSAVEHLVRARAHVLENPDRGQLFLFSPPAKKAEPEAAEVEVHVPARPPIPTPKAPRVTSSVAAPAPAPVKERKLDGKVLVTGAAGHLGANLVRRLLRDGQQVRVMLRQGSNNAAVDGLEVERVYGDLRDADSLARAVDGCESVYHCAATISTLKGDERLKKELYEANVLGARQLLAAAKAAGVVRTVVTGSFSATGEESDRKLPYAHTKELMEQEALRAVAEGQDVVIATSCALLGPHDYKPSPMGQTMLDYTHGKLHAYIPGGVAFVSAADVCEGHVLAMRRGEAGQRYVLSTEFATVDQLMDLFEEVSGRRRPRLKLPPGVMAPLAEVSSFVMSNLFPSKPQRFTPDAVRLLRQQLRADDTKARVELGYAPTDIRSAVHEAYADFARRGLVPGGPTMVSVPDNITPSAAKKGGKGDTAAA
ncbi:MAG: DNA mismatch repair protein MutS [Myxococcales bacterium]|nr:DNA mismatch repair protein MutS [Myxococcales bacterium]